MGRSRKWVTPGYESDTCIVLLCLILSSKCCIVVQDKQVYVVLTYVTSDTFPRFLPALETTDTGESCKRSQECHQTLLPKE